MPRSPPIKVEPPDQLSQWATLDELEEDGKAWRIDLPLPDGLRARGGGACGRGDVLGGRGRGGGRGGGSGARGGRGMPKTCGACKQLKKGGCACVKPKATGK